jgi:hypothetical protein
MRCSANTRNGSQCRRRAKHSFECCFQHLVPLVPKPKKIKQKEAKVQCRGMKRSGEQCKHMLTIKNKSRLCCYHKYDVYNIEENVECKQMEETIVEIPPELDFEEQKKSVKNKRKRTRKPVDNGNE